jgi:hypothetical protein
MFYLVIKEKHFASIDSSVAVGLNYKESNKGHNEDNPNKIRVLMPLLILFAATKVACTGNNISSVSASLISPVWQ